jgi:hypothetical protein
MTRFFNPITDGAGFDDFERKNEHYYDWHMYHLS